jgi:histidyl-tRNA synthetase
VERLSLLLEAAELTPAAPRAVAVVPVGEAAEAVAITLLQTLRGAGLVAEMAYRGNLKRRMERANRSKAAAAIILGEDEMAKGVAMLRNLDDGTQQEVPIENLVAALAETEVEGALEAAMTSELEAGLEAGSDAAAPTPRKGGTRGP